MQVSLLKDADHVPFSAFDFVANEDRLVLRSCSLMDLDHEVEFTKDLIKVQFPTEVKKEEKFFLFTERQLVAFEPVIKQLAVDGWEGLLFNEDEFNTQFIVSKIKELIC